MNVKTSLLKPYKTLGFSGIEMVEIVKNLNKLLANLIVHQMKLRNFHWNVMGNDFFELHELFESYYRDIDSTIDKVGERVRIFGEFPVSTLQTSLNLSSIKEVDQNLTSIEMNRQLVGDYDIILSLLVDTLNSASDHGDAGTVHMVNELILNLEKKHWMLNAWMRNETMKS